MRKLSKLLIFLILISMPSTLFAYDEFSSKEAPDRFKIDAEDIALILKGRMRIGLHDLQGKGGPGYDSTTDKESIKTRSPFVTMDSFDFAMRLAWRDYLKLNSWVRFRPSGATLINLFFEFEDDINDSITHFAEVGYNSNIVSDKKNSLRYSMASKAFYKNPEMHAVYGMTFKFAEKTCLQAIASLSMMRPLGVERLHESSEYKGTFGVLSQKSAEVYSGNAPAGTFLLRFESHKAYSEAFAFVGALAQEKGVEVLYGDFQRYRQLDGYKDSNDYRLAYWAGGRLGYSNYGVNFRVEGVYGKEDLIRRYAINAEAGYKYEIADFNWLNSYALYFRYDMLRFIGADKALSSGQALRSPDVVDALAWDYDIYTLTFKMSIYRGFFSFAAEYSFIDEKNGSKALGIADKKIDNNELQLRLEARY